MKKPCNIVSAFCKNIRNPPDQRSPEDFSVFDRFFMKVIVDLSGNRGLIGGNRGIFEVNVELSAVNVDLLGVFVGFLGYSWICWQ